MMCTDKHVIASSRIHDKLKRNYFLINLSNLCMKKFNLNLLMAVSLLWPPFIQADKAIFAGGCFWCMESDFETLPGVTDVISGFTGGKIENPTYYGNHDGHYEAVEITYDAEIVSYRELLDHFWLNIDPFDNQGQFCDKGHSYLSAIFVADDQQRELAEMSRNEVIKLFPDMEVVTPVLDAARFYPITGDEIGHQDFYKKNPLRYKTYRYLCGRDARLKQIWGDKATHQQES